MAFARTAALRRELEAALPRRPFTVRFWDGNEVAATEPAGPTFTVRSPRALAQALTAPGELGLGRAYVRGLLDVDDLDGALRIVDQFEPPRLTLAQGARLGLAAVRACGLTRRHARAAGLGIRSYSSWRRIHNGLVALSSRPFGVRSSRP